MPPPSGAISYAMQRREELQKIQAAYLTNCDPGDFWPGDIVLVYDPSGTVGHFAAMVLGRYRNSLSTYYMVEGVDMVAQGRGVGEIINSCDIVAPILLVSREDRNG